jgi:hypothetical protein
MHKLAQKPATSNLPLQSVVKPQPVAATINQSLIQNSSKLAQNYLKTIFNLSRNYLLARPPLS